MLSTPLQYTIAGLIWALSVCFIMIASAYSYKIVTYRNDRIEPEYREDQEEDPNDKPEGTEDNG